MVGVSEDLRKPSTRGDYDGLDPRPWRTSLVSLSYADLPAYGPDAFVVGRSFASGHWSDRVRGYQPIDEEERMSRRGRVECYR